MSGAAVLDQAHRGEDAAEGPANRRPVLVDRAALRPQVSAGTVRAPLEHQVAITVLLCEQVGQAFPIALLVDKDARVIAAGAGDRPSVAAAQAAKKARGVQPTVRLASFSVSNFGQLWAIGYLEKIASICLNALSKAACGSKPPCMTSASALPQT